MQESENVQPGRIVKVLRGRDEGKFAVIIGQIDHKFVWIADGDKRKFDQPKRKNVQHLLITGEISNEVAESISETGRVTNGKIRYAIGKFAQQQQTDAT